MFTQAAGLLRRLLEGELPQAKDGVRVGTTDGVSFYLCRDDAERHVVNNRLRTRHGYQSVAEVMPVEDTAHNCMVCNAMLSPQPAMAPPPPTAPAPPPGGQAPASESLREVNHVFKCANTACPKYKVKVNKKGPENRNKMIGSAVCSSCTKPLVWHSMGADTEPMKKPKMTTGRRLK